MSYQLYRNTTLGHTLQEALDELMQMQMLSPNLALKVLLQVCTNLYINNSNGFALSSNIIIIFSSLINRLTVRYPIVFAIKSILRQNC